MKTIGNFIANILDFFFGCRHANTSWPHANEESGFKPYKTCTDCGRKLPYNNDVLLGEAL